jgi:lipoprotein-anchoring transpeptidase ErfK/SrfK
MAGMGRQPEVRETSRAVTTVRPRYGRIAAAAGSALVTLVAVLGGTGVLPAGSASAQQATRGGSTPSSGGAVELSGAQRSPDSQRSTQATPPPRTTADAATKPGLDRAEAPRVPAGSGSGRRVVFDMSDQRVWLVGRRSGEDVTLRTYLVSGSVTGNLAPGSYSVYSRSLHATGVDDSGTMKYMVRFARGTRAAIGFHDIPVLDGSPVQTRDELGTPRSHGCIRQWRPDARALWRFAPTGTKVVVVA